MKFQSISEILNKHLILRGMLSYAISWPFANVIEQTIVEKRNLRTYDWYRVLRFCLFGGFILGPSMYFWVRLATIMWPRRDLYSSMCKAITEQLTIDPFVIPIFIYTMSRLEGFTPKEAMNLVNIKFFHAYGVGVIYWPTVQTINFRFVPYRNQVACTSVLSMIWGIFLAYVDSNMEIENENQLNAGFFSLVTYTLRALKKYIIDDKKTK